MTEAHNWIRGERAPSTAGRFELHAAAEPWEALGSWPLSSAEDVERGLRELAHGAGAWAALPAAERAQCLVRAGERLEADEELNALLRRRLGLAGEERPCALRAWGAAVREAPATSGVPGALALCIPDWTELVFGTWCRLAHELARGHGVALLSDARVPFVADGLARALFESGFPPEDLVVLHGVSDDGYPAALGAPAVRVLGASGDADRIRSLRHASQRHGVQAELRLKRCGVAEVSPREDLAARARQVLAAAFGRTATLSGQMPGQLGRVFCPEDRFSEFSELLLAELDGNTARGPLPMIDRKAVEHVQAAWARGLDEGATLVRGGEILGESARRRVAPAVFTNVEPGMQTARRVRPLPVLCLLRGRATTV